KETNLHTIWDSNMIDDTLLSYTELASYLDEPDQNTVVAWQKNSVRHWADESMTFRKQVYEVGDGSLSFKYSYKNMPTVKERLLQAGIRLAGILNEIYGK